MGDGDEMRSRKEDKRDIKRGPERARMHLREAVLAVRREAAVAAEQQAAGRRRGAAARGALVVRADEHAGPALQQQTNKDR